MGPACSPEYHPREQQEQENHYPCEQRLREGAANSGEPLVILSVAVVAISKKLHLHSEARFGHQVRIHPHTTRP